MYTVAYSMCILPGTSVIIGGIGMPFVNVAPGWSLLQGSQDLIPYDNLPHTYGVTANKQTRLTICWGISNHMLSWLSGPSFHGDNSMFTRHINALITPQNGRYANTRDHFVNASSQWDTRTSLQGAYRKWALEYKCISTISVKFNWSLLPEV